MQDINVFIKKKEGEKIMITLKEDSTFDELMNKYYNKFGKEKVKFFHKSKDIMDYSNSTLAELGIKNMDEILVISSEEDCVENLKDNIVYIKFKGNGIEIIIQSNGDDKMKDIFDKFFKKIIADKTNTKFYYNEQLINPELKLNEIVNKEDKEKNMINVVWIENNNNEIKDISNIEENNKDIQNNKSENKLAQVNFKGKGIDITIFCQSNDKMENIIDKFCEQTQLDKYNLKFSYEEKKVFLYNNLTFIELASDIDKKRNKVEINVNEEKKEYEAKNACPRSIRHAISYKPTLLSKIVEVIFQNEGMVIYIYCYNDDKMKDIFDKFFKKIKIKENEVKFYYNEQLINPELILDEVVSKEDRTKKVMNIICLKNEVIYDVIFQSGHSGQQFYFQSKGDVSIGILFNKFTSKLDLDKNEVDFLFNGIKLNDQSEKTLNDIICGGDKLRITYYEHKNICGAAGFSIKNILEEKTSLTSYIIEINFIELGQEGKEMIIQCNINDKIGDIFNRCFPDKLKEKEEVEFIYESKKITSESTINKIINYYGKKIKIYFTIKTKSENNLPKNNNEILKEKEKEKTRKYDLNILYYDENLKNKENSDNCAFFDMNTNGTFYGCHNFELFKIVLEKIKNNQKEFILITSGSSAEKIIDYCYKFQFVRECYIYCFNLKKYLPLMNKYPKIKGIYNEFDKLKEKLYTIEPMDMKNIASSNLIYFEDYSRIYIKLHYEFIRKYFIYKIIKSKNCNEFQLLALVEKEYPNLLDWVKQLFPDKNEIINFFKEYVAEKDKSDEKLNNILNCDDNILNDNIKSYIRNYTLEDFYYQYLNRFLRQGNFNAFRILSSHITKFIFKLYDYREKISASQKKNKLYRKMYLNPKDIKLYEKSIGRVICYPAFTSTSISKDAFTPNKYDENLELVLLIIKQNDTKSVVSIKEYSEYEKEEEYLFFPFSFFKIENVQLKEGNIKNPHIINLTALYSEKPIEEMFSNFMEKVTDNLNPEGLDLLLLKKNNTQLVFNPTFLDEPKKSCLII